VAAPTALLVEVDREEYSRFEPDRDTITVSVTPTGTNLFGEQVQVELRKARRARDEIAATVTITFDDAFPKTYSVQLHLPDLVDDKTISKVRRGEYFIRAISVTNPAIEDDTDDFRIALITVARLKDDYLHGTDQFSSDQLAAQEQPQRITGVTIEDVSQGHPKQWIPLSFNFAIDQVPTVVGVTAEPFVLSDGMTLVLRVDGGDPLTATFHTADFVNIALATAAEVAVVISTDIPSVTASDEGGKVQIEGGNLSLYVDPAGTATTILGLLNQGVAATVTRTLSWCNGPVMIVERAGTYILRRGDTADYITVRVASVAELPTESRAEEILISRKPLDAERIRQILDQAISWVEDSAIGVYLEPTRVVTEIDPDVLAYPAGTDIPSIVGADWDRVVDALLYTVPTAGHWIGFRMPAYPVLYFDELYGKVSNTRVVDIALEWVEAHERTGWVELVPFAQETAFNYIGLVWVESLRGPVPIPNFWNFNAMVGFRDTPRVLLELTAKKAAMDILTIAGQAFRGGFASQSISRDGVSESVSYTASATFGIYSATIEDYKKWIDANLAKLRGAFRGPNMVVL
jgi:hypothetical protein